MHRLNFSYRVLLFVFVCLLGLFGCNKEGAAPSGTTGAVSSSGGAEGKKLKIGVSIPAADHGWTAGVKYWADEAAKLYPDIEWNIQTSPGPDEQIKVLDTMMVGGMDAIVVLATESAPVTPKAKEIHERGILLINVDRGFLEPVADVFIEGDNKAFGRKSAEYIVQKLGGDLKTGTGGSGNILILEGISSTVNTDRVKAAEEVFRRFPGIKILDQQQANWNQLEAYNKMQTMLLKHPQVDAIWAQDDDMALGVEKALKEAQRDKNIWILGGAGMKDIVKRVMDGDPLYPADITYPPSMIAVGIQQAVTMLRAGDLAKVKQFTPKHIMIDVELITPENAKDYYFPDSIF
jgi:ribose transport system substrate-binding protein